MRQQAFKAARIILNSKDRIQTAYGNMNEQELARLILHEVVHKIKVTVEVTRGIAEVILCPKGIEVEIIDHDDERR